MSRPRDKGTIAETAVVEYLRTHGYPRAERRAMNGASDRGDIAGVDGLCVEIKAHASHSYGAWLLETERERLNAGVPYGVLVHKPAGLGLASVDQWRVVMTLDTFVRLLDRMRHE